MDTVSNMSTDNDSDAPFSSSDAGNSGEFIEKVLPRIHGSLVTIRLQPSGQEYRVSREVLCSQSEYFSRMFRGCWKEGADEVAILEEIKGVVSPQSLASLLEFFYVGKCNFKVDTPELEISKVIEFARLADMCGAQELESITATHLKETITNNVLPIKTSRPRTHPGDSNTHLLTSKHLQSVCLLPPNHPLRQVLVQALADNFIRSGKSAFWKDIESNPAFAVDLLREVRHILRSLTVKGAGCMYITDPFSGEMIPINGLRS